MSQRLPAGIIIGAVLTLAACGGDGGDNVAPAPAPDPDFTLGVSQVFPDLTFDSPVGMLQAPDAAARWFVIEQDGAVRVFTNDAAATTSTAFIDIRARVSSPADGSGPETGLLGMAFHPSFPTDPRVYLSYTATAGELVSRISEFLTSDGGATLDPATETVLLTVNQPQRNHNGGGIAFGPDDFLYIGFGDGGGAGDEHGAIGNGQSLHTLLGKILRVNVDDTASGFNYAIPADNPFAGNALCGDDGAGTEDCPEIYAYGFHNP